MRKIHSIRLQKFAVFLAICAVLLSSVSAVETQKVSYEKYEDFVNGKASGVSLTSEGSIRTAPALKEFSTLASAFLWDAVFDRDGNLFVSAGDKAKVWKITPDGKAVEFFTSEDTNVFALAINSKGEIFIATSPDGKVLKLDKEGKSSVFFEPKQKNIFALLFDSNDNLFVATGDKGVIYKVSPDGKGEVFYDSDEPNIVSLAWDKDKNLLAGSQGTGLLYRIDPSGKTPYVLLSSNQKEIKRIALTPDGGIYVLVLDGIGAETPATEIAPTLNSFSHPAGPQGVAIAAPLPVISTPGGTEGQPGQIESGAPGKGGSSELYFISPDGLPEKIWVSKFTGHSLAIREGKALVGTGDEGYLFEVDSKGKADLILKASSGQITKLAPKSDGTLFLVGSNPGAIWSISKDRREEGTYESEVFNSSFFVRWGHIQATVPKTGDSRVAIFTRSGNTPASDKSWSEWQECANGQIPSPSAQYLQYKLVLKGRDTIVEDVVFFYLPVNLAPQVSSIEILASSNLPFPIQFNTPGMTPAMVAAQLTGMQVNRNMPQAPRGDAAAQQMMMQPVKPLGAPARGLHVAFWNASDPNQDNLLYNVSYKFEGDDTWHPLEEGLDAPVFVWDTTGWPDGNYFLKIEATDSPSNPPADVKTASDTSRRFQIDHTPPVMSNVSVSGKQATFTVKDSLSTIKSVSVSTDGVNYFPLAPSQGILDSLEKSFIYTAPDLVNRVFIRMEDADGNIGAAKIDFQ